MDLAKSVLMQRADHRDLHQAIESFLAAFQRRPVLHDVRADSQRAVDIVKSRHYAAPLNSRDRTPGRSASPKESAAYMARQISMSAGTR